MLTDVLIRLIYNLPVFRSSAFLISYGVVAIKHVDAFVTHKAHIHRKFCALAAVTNASSIFVNSNTPGLYKTNDGDRNYGIYEFLCNLCNV